MKNRHRLQMLLQKPDLSNREIGRRLICSPTTIAKLRGRIEVLGLTLDELDAMTDSQLHAWNYDRPAASAELIWPDWDLVLADIQAGNNRTEAYDLFLDRVGEGKPIADRTFREHLGPLLDKKNPTMRLLHRPGDKAMVDYAG